VKDLLQSGSCAFAEKIIAFIYLIYVFQFVMYNIFLYLCDEQIMPFEI